MDDPIVMPGMKDMSHSHDFFGNETTDANSTLSSLLSGPTTCSLGDDNAAYWAPTLYKNGEAITPEKAAIYYRTQVDGGVVQPFPAGLEMIAGDSHATGPQPIDIVYYNCHEGPDQHQTRGRMTAREAPSTRTSASPSAGTGSTSIRPITRVT